MGWVAKKEELQYPTPKDWRDKVLEAIGPDRGAQADLARKIRCSPGTLNELLHNGKHSHLVPAIHKALGWPPPTLPATGSTDQHEIEVVLKKMGKSGRELIKNLSALDSEQLAVAVALVEQLAKAKKKQAND